MQSFQGHHRFWTPNNTFDYLTDKIDMNFISMAGSAGDALPDPGLETLGRKPRQEFLCEVSHSLPMVGIGNPTLSPTPYASLCLGIPFVNPIHDWDRSDQHNRE